MADKRDYTEEEKKWTDWHMKNWRAWGSWFSWGSPVGLSIFLWTLAGIVWIFIHK